MNSITGEEVIFLVHVDTSPSYQHAVKQKVTVQACHFLFIVLLIVFLFIFLSPAEQNEVQ